MQNTHSQAKPLTRLTLLRKNIPDSFYFIVWKHLTFNGNRFSSFCFLPLDDRGKSAAEISFCEKQCFFSSLFSFAILLLPFSGWFESGGWRAFRSDGKTYINVIPISFLLGFPLLVFFWLFLLLTRKPFSSLVWFNGSIDRIFPLFIDTKTEQSLNLCCKIAIRLKWKFLLKISRKYYEIIFIKNSFRRKNKFKIDGFDEGVCVGGTKNLSMERWFLFSNMTLWALRSTF